MKIEIWADVCCPFCYIGYKNLQEAIAKVKVKVDIEWKSYQLDPSIPFKTTKATIHEYLAHAKDITINEAKNAHHHVRMMGERAGLQFDFDTVLVANSQKALELLHFAQTMGKGTELMNILFHSYFSLGKDIADLDTLVFLGKKAGLNEEQIRTSLRERKFKTKVETDHEEGDELGLQGIPFFVFDREFALTGVQPVDVFEEALRGELK